MRYVVEWNGRPVDRINKGFRSARRLAGLGADVVPHTLRHTCATWLALRHVPIHEICGFLGMTRETFERVYGHHHPDFQASETGTAARGRAQHRRHRMGLGRSQSLSARPGVD
jgi:integrase